VDRRRCNTCRPHHLHCPHCRGGGSWCTALHCLGTVVAGGTGVVGGVQHGSHHHLRIMLPSCLCLKPRQFLGKYNHPLPPLATTTIVLVHHPGIHCILPPPCNPAFLLLLLQLSCPPQSSQLDSCQRWLWMMEPDTGGVDDSRLSATLECSSGRHATSWGAKGYGMHVGRVLS
jgi:hypothetical protein